MLSWTVSTPYCQMWKSRCVPSCARARLAGPRNGRAAAPAAASAPLTRVLRLTRVDCRFIPILHLCTLRSLPVILLTVRDAVESRPHHLHSWVWRLRLLLLPALNDGGDVCRDGGVEG